jgi:hypothetical protein
LTELLEFLGILFGFSRSNREPLTAGQLWGLAALFLGAGVVFAGLAWLSLNYSVPRHSTGSIVVTWVFGAASLISVMLAVRCSVLARRAD